MSLVRPQDLLLTFEPDGRILVKSHLASALKPLLSLQFFLHAHNHKRESLSRQWLALGGTPI